MEFDKNSGEEFDTKRQQEINSVLLPETCASYAQSPQYPHEAVPETDIMFLQQIAIGKYPEEIGDKEEVLQRLRDLNESGIDFPYNGNGLTPRERQFIYYFQEGATTTAELAKKLNTSQTNIRNLRSQVEEKLETPYQPDRTFTPMEQAFLDKYNSGIIRVKDLARELNTSPANIGFLKFKIIKKNVDIQLEKKQPKHVK